MHLLNIQSNEHITGCLTEKQSIPFRYQNSRRTQVSTTKFSPSSDAKSQNLANFIVSFPVFPVPFSYCRLPHTPSSDTLREALTQAENPHPSHISSPLVGGLPSLRQRFKSASRSWTLLLFPSRKHEMVINPNTKTPNCSRSMALLSSSRRSSHWGGNGYNI